MIARARSLVIAAALVVAPGCRPPPSEASVEPGPTRLPILEPAYGADPASPEAVGPGAQLDALELPLADGGSFELGAARGAGPVVLVWIGGAEHEQLIAWVGQLDGALAQLDARAATLVFVRPLEPEAALRWAIDERLQTTVAGDPEGVLAAVLDVPRELAVLDFAVLIVSPDGVVRYRKLGGRRPELDELFAVLDGEAASLRCCPGACVGPPCE